MNSASCCKIKDNPNYSKVINISKVYALFKNASSRFYELPNESNPNKVTLTWKNIDFLIEGVDLKEFGDHVYFDINMILEDLHSDNDNNLFGNIKLSINQSYEHNGQILLDLGITRIRKEDGFISDFLISSSKITELSGKFESIDFVELYLKLNKPISRNRPPYENDTPQKKKLFNASEENVKLLMEDITKNARISMNLYTRNNITRFIPNNFGLSNGSKNINLKAKGGCELWAAKPAGNCVPPGVPVEGKFCRGCDTRACNCECRCDGEGNKVCGCFFGCTGCGPGQGEPCYGCKGYN